MTKLFFLFVLDDTPYEKEEFDNCKLIENVVNHVQLLTKKRHLENEKP